MSDKIKPSKSTRMLQLVLGGVAAIVLLFGVIGTFMDGGEETDTFESTSSSKSMF